MDTAPETPKPKRHYTVTDKVREARRASLAKAREKARTALRGYERGPQEDDVAYEARLARQVKPWCANLRRAVAAKKADESAHYASHFTHGVTAPDLDRSAAAAGEDRDELRRHIEQCQETIGGLADCRFSIDDCRLNEAGPAPADSGLADCQLPIDDCRLPGDESSDSEESADGANRQSAIGNPSSRWR